MLLQSRLVYIPRENVIMEEFNDGNDGDSPPVTHQDLRDLIKAIDASRSQMDGQLKAIKEEML